MAIHWRNKIIKLITGTLIAFMLIGCKSHKKLSENVVSESVETFNRTELVVKENPYKIEVKETVTFDSIGAIVPIKLLIKKDGVVGEVTLDNNELKYTLERKDTLLVSTSIKEVEKKETKTDTVVIVEKKKGFFESIKSYANTILWTLISIVVLYLIYKVIRKVSFPI